MSRASTLTTIIILAYIIGVCPVAVHTSVGAEEEATLNPIPIELAGWASEDAKYTNPIEGEVIEVDGKKQLKLTYKGGETDKAVFCKPMDKILLPQSGTLQFRARNAGTRDVKITVAFKTGENWVFHESKEIKVKDSDDKFYEVSVDLTDDSFKSEATKWKNKGTISDPGQIKSIQLAVYNGNRDGALIVTDLEVMPKP